jgi:hypothetical protein
VLKIEQFKPLCTRIPAGHKRGMTVKAYLFLEVNYAKLLGAGEKTFGNPADVDAHSELRVWVSGLRLGGSGG